jgi:predicted nucleic acid-binding protein
LLYLDASALVKLVQPESETAALIHELARWPDQVSSPIAEVELHRAARRIGQRLRRAEDVLAQLSFLPFDEDVRLVAGAVGSPSLRSLDAIHLASALSLGDDLGAFCCYDRRLLADAEAAKLTVISPGLH